MRDSAIALVVCNRGFAYRSHCFNSHATYLSAAYVICRLVPCSTLCVHAVVPRVRQEAGTSRCKREAHPSSAHLELLCQVG